MPSVLDHNLPSGVHRSVIQETFGRLKEKETLIVAKEFGWSTDGQQEADSGNNYKLWFGN